MRVNERLDEAASLARRLLVLIESARARESSDRLTVATTDQTPPSAPPSSGPSPTPWRPELVSVLIQSLQAYVEGRLALDMSDARVVDDAIARLIRAADRTKG